jgi:hypothetical protein
MNLSKTLKTSLVFSMLLNVFSVYANAEREKGGGFLGAAKVVKTAAKHTADDLRAADNPWFLFPDLQQSGMSLVQFADIIEKVRINDGIERTEVYQGNSRLKLLDYGVDAGGPYIEVLKPYSAWIEGQLSHPPIAEIETRLIHEASHLIGVSEENADSFAARLMEAVRLYTTSNLPSPNDEVFRLGARRYLRLVEAPIYMRITSVSTEYSKDQSENAREKRNRKMKKICDRAEVRVCVNKTPAQCQSQKVSLDTLFSLPEKVLKKGLNTFELGVFATSYSIIGDCAYSIELLDSQRKVFDGDFIIPQSTNMFPINEFTVITH